MDAHKLIALCALRPGFIGDGATQNDAWSDARGMFMAAAGPVYELLGEKGLITTNFPPIQPALVDGSLAIHQQSDGHRAAHSGEMISGQPGLCWDKSAGQTGRMIRMSYGAGRGPGVTFSETNSIKQRQSQ